MSVIIVSILIITMPMTIMTIMVIIIIILVMLQLLLSSTAGLRLQSDLRCACCGRLARRELAADDQGDRTGRHNLPGTPGVFFSARCRERTCAPDVSSRQPLSTGQATLSCCFRLACLRFLSTCEGRAWGVVLGIVLQSDGARRCAHQKRQQCRNRTAAA